MCCLFGMIDCHGRFRAREKARILSVLATECEERGTDATGIAYCTHDHLSIYKRPLEAHRLRFRIPEDSRVIMGHTRMTTQGKASRNRNNHPFLGNAAGEMFALAHNGILYNDQLLRRTNRLPKTKIETDSYIAVQLIEQKKALDFSSLKYMAEQVEGTFTFTVLDQQENLYVENTDASEPVQNKTGCTGNVEGETVATPIQRSTIAPTLDVVDAVTDRTTQPVYTSGVDVESNSDNAIGLGEIVEKTRNTIYQSLKKRNATKNADSTGWLFSLMAFLRTIARAQRSFGVIANCLSLSMLSSSLVSRVPAC